MDAMTLIGRVWKVERPHDRYVPYVTVELYRIDDHGHTVSHGAIELSEMTFRNLTGEDPTPGAEYEISMVRRG